MDNYLKGWQIRVGVYDTMNFVNELLLHTLLDTHFSVHFSDKVLAEYSSSIILIPPPPYSVRL